MGPVFVDGYRLVGARDNLPPRLRSTFRGRMGHTLVLRRLLVLRRHAGQFAHGSREEGWGGGGETERSYHRLLEGEKFLGRRKSDDARILFNVWLAGDVWEREREPSVCPVKSCHRVSPPFTDCLPLRQVPP